MDNITTLLNQIGKITKRHEEIAKISGENFNVFNVIGVTTKEVMLHSKFIAELLNPNGSHGQGDAFLSLFIDTINEKEEEEKKIIIENFDITSAEVLVEKRVSKINEDKTEGGQIDVLIKDKNNKTIIIENKIYAPDQKNQLLRYFNYSKDNLLYLTLFGDEPSDYSKEKLEINKDFYCISYEKDILNWLIKCRKKAIQQPLLREGISHYINVIKLLTGQTMNEAMKKEIVEVLTKSPENFKNAIDIANSVTNAKVKIQWGFWQALQEKIRENHKIVKEITMNDVAEFYKTLNPTISIQIEIKKDLFFGIESANVVYFGIRHTNNDAIYSKKIEEELKNYNFKTNGGWLVWYDTHTRVYFKDFNQNDFDFTNSESVKNKAIEIAEEAINDIEKFKKELNKLEN